MHKSLLRILKYLPMMKPLSSIVGGLTMAHKRYVLRLVHQSETSRELGSFRQLAVDTEDRSGESVVQMRGCPDVTTGEFQTSKEAVTKLPLCLSETPIRR